jgi:hypothetical protein
MRSTTRRSCNSRTCARPLAAWSPSTTRALRSAAAKSSG